MRIGIFLLLIALPLIEIGVLIKVGGWLGFWPTFGIVVATALLGVAIMMEHGFNAALRVQRAVLDGEAPLATMLEASMVVIAGVLLVTPGLLADVVGLVLLVPPVRRWAAGAVGRSFLVLDPARTRPEAGDARFEQRAEGRGFRPEPRPPENGGAGPVIEGEFKRLDERPVDPERPAGREEGR